METAPNLINSNRLKGLFLAITAALGISASLSNQAIAESYTPNLGSQIQTSEVFAKPTPPPERGCDRQKDNCFQSKV